MDGGYFQYDNNGKVHFIISSKVTSCFSYLMCLSLRTMNRVISIQLQNETLWNKLLLRGGDKKCRKSISFISIESDLLP